MLWTAILLIKLFYGVILCDENGIGVVVRVLDMLNTQVFLKSREKYACWTPVYVLKLEFANEFQTSRVTYSLIDPCCWDLSNG